MGRSTPVKKPTPLGGLGLLNDDVCPSAASLNGRQTDGLEGIKAKRGSKREAG